MRIFIATGIYPPDIGGPATYAKIISEELSRRGHHVRILTYGEESRIEGNVKIFNVSRKIPKGIRHVIYFLKALRYGSSSDIVYALDTVSAGLPARITALLLRRTFFLRVAGDYAWEQGVERFGVKDLLDDFLEKEYGKEVARLRKIQNFVARGAQKIIVPSVYLKTVVERWNVGDSTRICVIPNSVKFSPSFSKDEARAKLGLEGFVFLSAGRMVPWKGFEMLIRCMSKIQDGKTRLVLAGDGPDRERLEGLRSSLGLKDIVLMPGALQKSLLETYMAASDVFLLNTGYEGFSHQLLAAMIMGLPVVTTLEGGNKEIIANEENALVAGYNNEEEWIAALERIREHANLRLRLKDGGQRYQNIFTTNAMIDALLEEFQLS